MTKRSPEKSPEKITLEEAQSALRRSGYLVEARIARLLKGRRVGDRRYAVYPNWGYEDRVTGKTRELNIYAELVVSPVSSWINFMTHSLIIECVNNPQPLVLFTSGTGSSALMMDHEILKWRTQASIVPFAADGSGGRQPLCQL